MPLDQYEQTCRETAQSGASCARKDDTDKSYRHSRIPPGFLQVLSEYLGEHYGPSDQQRVYRGLALIPAEAIVALALALEHGAIKYDPRNWENGLAFSRVYDAMHRHLAAWWTGQVNDQDSELPVIAHIMANAAFLATYDMRMQDYGRYRGYDDRPNTAQPLNSDDPGREC